MPFGCICACPGHDPWVCRLAAHGRQWSYLGPAERASVEERFEHRVNPALLDTHGTDRTISMTFSDYSTLNAFPLSPTPSLHYARPESGPMFAQSANLDQRLGIVEEGSAPAALTEPTAVSSSASMPVRDLIPGMSSVH